MIAITLSKTSEYAGQNSASEARDKLLHEEKKKFPVKERCRY